MKDGSHRMCIYYIELKKLKMKNLYDKLQQLHIPIWKWEQIAMDFFTNLSRTKCGVDSIWFIMDRLNKSPYFIPILYSISAENLADIYIKEVVARHGVPVFVTFDRLVRFTSRFCKKFHEELGTHLHFTTSYHP